MLRITVLGCEEWDDAKQEFIYSKDQLLVLEHSLVSLSKWEAKWNKSFLSTKDKTNDEVIDYIRCMTVNHDVPKDTYFRLTASQINEINEYIGAPMTATTFGNRNDRPSREIITSEIIYYWMILYNIPFECEKWHLNRLITLIRVCSIKGQKSKPMSKKDTAAMYARLNAERRKKMNSKG